MAYQILQGDTREVLKTLPSESVQCVVTSPPYFGLRDYGHDGQIGLEPTPAAYVAELVAVFREVRRVLRNDGTLWLNLGDSYANDGKWGGYTGGKHAQGVHGTLVGRQRRYSGLKPKDLIGIPWRVAFALQDDGWYLRSDIIWSKPNVMPESVTDRPTRSHEYIFLLSKSAQYTYDHDAIKEPCESPTEVRLGRVGAYQNKAIFGTGDGTTATKIKDKQSGHGRRHAGFNERWDAKELEGSAPEYRNKRTVWSVPTNGYADAHFATFPPDLIRPCVRAGAPAGGVVLDPFNGAATTGVVCIEEGRDYIGIEINPKYVAMSERRLRNTQPPLFALTGDAA